jgi:hypothetical protein
MIKQILEHLGADPTAMTPSADVAAVADAQRTGDGWQQASMH